MICVIKSGYQLLIKLDQLFSSQDKDHFINNCINFKYFSSIITEKDLFGESHFVDEDSKINLKKF